LFCKCGQGTQFSRFHNGDILCRHQLELGAQFIDPTQLFHYQFATPQTFTILDLELHDAIEFVDSPKKPKK
jgi:hypothetical protein